MPGWQVLDLRAFRAAEEPGDGVLFCTYALLGTAAKTAARPRVGPVPAKPTPDSAAMNSAVRVRGLEDERVRVLLSSDSCPSRVGAIEMVLKKR